MEPTLTEHGLTITNSLVYHLRAPQRGDVIVFRYPYATKGGTIYNLKRIIGLPNETLSIAGVTVHIKKDGNENIILSEPYIAIRGENREGTTTLGADEYFVMSDNRSEKSDSRTWGSLKKTFIEGPVIFHNNGKFLYSLFNRLNKFRE